MVQRGAHVHDEHVIIWMEPLWSLEVIIYYHGVTVDFAKREGYIVLEQITSYCSLFFFVFWISIYSW